MISKNALFACASLAFISPLILACGQATDARTDPSPAKPVEVADFSTDGADDVALGEVADEDEAAKDLCNALQAQQFVGQEMNLETRTALLEAVAPTVQVRFLQPDSAEPVDEIPKRLNISTDENSEITDAYCG